MTAANALCQAPPHGAPQVHHSSKYRGLASEDGGYLMKAEQEYAKALAGATELDLKNLALVSLPDNLGDCSALEVFDCDVNKLTSLPESIGKCTSLVALFCNESILETLPKSLGSCVELKILYCCANKLTELPENIGDCTALANLWCSNNKLGELPESLGNCTALNDFSCHDNNLTTLPESLSKCTALEALYCRNNPWDPAWLKAQGLDPGGKPTVESLQVLVCNNNWSKD